MALIQISEPGQSTVAHHHRLAAGIDLGTTNSMVASVRSGEASVLPDHQGNVTLPSVVQYHKNYKIIGQEAYNSASNFPQNTIVSVKRFIGKSLEDVRAHHSNLPYEFSPHEQGLPIFKTAQGLKNAIQVSADILKPLVDRAEATLGGDLQGVVITVPAYFDDAQRHATKEAAKLVGIPVLRLLNEPTAAAIAYGLDQQEEGIIVVYDFGGGTFDVSILRLEQGVFQVLATGGDTTLGGDDIDLAVVNHIKQNLNLTKLSPEDERCLLSLARSLKEELSFKEDASLELTVQSSKLSYKLNRAELESLIKPLIQKTLHVCKRALRDAKISSSEINEIVMVGGSTRTPLVQKMTTTFFGQAPLTSINPDQIVAIGAAQQADILVGNKPEAEVLLLDVIPLSLGIEIMGGLTEKVIPRNTTLPIARAQTFTTFKDGQTAMSFHVVQGERELVQDCRSLAKFELRGIPPMNAGVARIEVTFNVDADGLLSVTAQEKTQNIKAHIEVKPSFGLTESEIADMLKDSMAHAGDDINQRMLVEKKVEAQRVIEAISSALKTDQSLLTESELLEINTAITELEHAMQSPELEHLKESIANLDRTTQVFASRRMDASIKQALKGQSVDKI
jgi:molecular chaperone HscA